MMVSRRCEPTCLRIARGATGALLAERHCGAANAASGSRSVRDDDSPAWVRPAVQRRRPCADDVAPSPHRLEYGPAIIGVGFIAAVADSSV